VSDSFQNILDVTVKPLFWEEEHSMQLLNNANAIWTVHIKTGKTVCQCYG